METKEFTNFSQVIVEETPMGEWRLECNKEDSESFLNLLRQWKSEGKIESIKRPVNMHNIDADNVFLVWGFDGTAELIETMFM